MGQKFGPGLSISLPHQVIFVSTLRFNLLSNMTLKSHNLKMLYCESSMQKWNFALFMGKKFSVSTGAEWSDCFHFGVKTLQSQTVLPSCWKCNGYLRWLLVACEQTQICLSSSRASALWKGVCASDPTVCLPFFFLVIIKTQNSELPPGVHKPHRICLWMCRNPLMPYS